MSGYEKCTARANGASADYIKFGSGERAFVILPGLSIKSVLFMPEGVVTGFAAFTQRYTVYLFDRRNELPEHYTMREMAEDAAAFIKAAGIVSADIFGVSQGGMLAQYIAIEHPDLVHALVLGSTASRLGEEQLRRLDEWREPAARGNAKGLCDAFADKVYSPAVREQFRSAIDALAGITTPEDLARFTVLAGACDGFDIYDRLGEIKCPALVLGAGDDRVLGVGASREIAEKLGCELYIYEGYGHAVYDEAPDYRERMLNFLSEL